MPTAAVDERVEPGAESGNLDDVRRCRTPARPCGPRQLAATYVGVYRGHQKDSVNAGQCGVERLRFVVIADHHLHACWRFPITGRTAGRPHQDAGCQTVVIARGSCDQPTEPTRESGHQDCALHRASLRAGRPRLHLTFLMLRQDAVDFGDPISERDGANAANGGVLFDTRHSTRGF